MFGENYDSKTILDGGLVTWMAPAGYEFENLVHNPKQGILAFNRRAKCTV